MSSRCHSLGVLIEVCTSQICPVNYTTQIKSRRIAMGWTQSELADRCGVTLRTIQRIEKGEVQPSLYTKTRLMEVLQIEVGDFESSVEITENESLKSKPLTVMQTFFALLHSKKFLWIASSLILITTSVWKGIGLFSEPEFSRSSPPKGFEIQTINCGSNTECDIELTRKDDNGTILWQKTYGGSSYEKAAGVIAVPGGGFLILGSTSSFGNGNYDILLIRTDEMGEVIWQKTYGGFFNEYGESISLDENKSLFRISGVQQVCTTPNVSQDCLLKDWSFLIDLEGQELGQS